MSKVFLASEGISAVSQTMDDSNNITHVMSLHVISESYGDSSDHESSSSDDDDISIGKHRSARHSAARQAHDSGEVPSFFQTPFLLK